MISAISFTGSRHGCTAPQFAALTRHLEAVRENQISQTMTAIHGGCIGADRQFHDICRERLWGTAVRIVIHPASNVPKELTDWSDADELLPARSTREQNEAIVRAARGLLLACPAGVENDPGQLRSGTWQTVRMARRLGVGLVVVMPDGSIQ